MLNPQQAIQRLKDGNQRFLNGTCNLGDLASQSRREELVAGQKPFAIILGCADARVPAEIVFDHGLGDLFVIRIAGNIVAPSQIGSIEFAAKEFGTRLVVVLGHSNCGAVAATLNDIRQEEDTCSKNLLSIVDRIRPAVKPLLSQPCANDPDELLLQAVRANIHASVQQLRTGSPILETLQEEGLRIIGAKYSLKRGVVDFFEDA